MAARQRRERHVALTDVRPAARDSGSRCRPSGWAASPVGSERLLAATRPASTPSTVASTPAVTGGTGPVVTCVGYGNRIYSVDKPYSTPEHSAEPTSTSLPAGAGSGRPRGGKAAGGLGANDLARAENFVDIGGHRMRPSGVRRLAGASAVVWTAISAHVAPDQIGGASGHPAESRLAWLLPCPPKSTKRGFT